MKPFLLKYQAAAITSFAQYTWQKRCARVVAVLNHLRVAPSSLSPGPATVSDGSAVGLQQPAPRHRHYNYSVHREPESSSFLGLPFYKGDVDNAAQVKL